MPYVETTLGGSASGALLPPRRTQVKTEGSSRCSAVATSETCETRPERPASSTASASNPGRTTTGVPVTIERVTTDEPPDVRQRQAGQPRVPGGVDAEPGRGRPGRGGDGVVGEHDALGLARRARASRRPARRRPRRGCRPASACCSPSEPTIRVGRSASSSTWRAAGGSRGSRGAAASPVSQMARSASTKPMPPGRSSATSSGTGQ